jgi:peptidoglycan/LPS O-acetylase OafA/YrhL
MVTREKDRALGRMPALDGLRTFAVACTSLVHLAPSIAPGGIFGVDLFFVLSGFLITSILLQEFGGTGRINLGTFYIRRARRLLPAVVALLLVFTVSALATMPSARDLLVTAVVDISVMTYTFNWTGVLGHDSPWQVDHLWSLSVEEQFYILWPVALVLVLGRVSRRALLTLTLVAAVASCAAQAAVYLGSHSVNWAFLASPCMHRGSCSGAAWVRSSSGGSPTAAHSGSPGAAGPPGWPWPAWSLSPPAAASTTRSPISAAWPWRSWPPRCSCGAWRRRPRATPATTC